MELITIYTFKYKQIGRKVAYYRRLRNLTQEELARRVNISTSSLSKIECGSYNNNLSIAMLLAIAEGLNIELAMLVNFDAREKALEWDEANSAPNKIDSRWNKQD
ncbi:helix-turn-helix transcriptional regulator [Sporomusa sp.]|uniref:helix-turn-helix domain-containing protein n=1 Tax=Sporomusa sp. TaxID=2078658 RepID=UPI002B59B4B3|nr:helix-turn-helix transcriptional regulator [Sporomusa sp.]HWR05458.1 helix-turn-helix transcriptional regulator [Sporomusa sp.]